MIDILVSMIYTICAFLVGMLFGIGVEREKNGDSNIILTRGDNPTVNDINDCTGH